MSDLAYNKLARRDYDILDTLEAGLVLSGQEVKSVRGGQMKLQGAYVTIARGEAWLVGAHIPRYKPAGALAGYDPGRSRKLLVHRRELVHLAGKAGEKGLTLLPLRVYTRREKLKLEVGIGRGRKEFEKRELIKKRDVEREIRNRLKR
ncbi:SsrA-binding protein SmpB [Candidatus Uhrbacteria bacterium]|nr:SsrA-binding protein SmpB [Candidatus Uhrbacteria bacterium]